MESSPESPQPLRVVVAALKGWVERTGPVWVEGQVIQLKRRAGSLHFLTLRDKLAEVSVNVAISTATLDAAGPITEGALVSARVKATIRPNNGSLTFDCTDLRPSGEGRLLAHLEQRRRALQAEGLFSPDLKKPLPFLPRKIGLVTGKDSAAERDVLSNVRRRWPGAVIVVRHSLVQGPQAVAQVVDAVSWLDREPDVDVIVIARGGGSMEDLLPFSDETLVRAVFACRTPVVSAIGHESDTPILDLVADLRASTPTDAAKRIVPDAAEERRFVAEGHNRLRRSILRRVRVEQERLDGLRSRPVLRDPSGTLKLQDQRLADLRDRLRRGVRIGIEREEAVTRSSLARVRSLSPRATLHRGYAIVTTDDGRTVTSVSQVEPDEIIVARFADGDVAAAVIDIEPTSAHEYSVHEEDR